MHVKIGGRRRGSGVPAITTLLYWQVGEQVSRMFGRFFQLFLLASIVLLLPTFFYLSRQQYSYNPAKDFALLQMSGQTSQGSGPPPALDPQIAQAWKWSSLLDGNNGQPAGKPGHSEPNPPKDVIMPKMDNATAK